MKKIILQYAAVLGILAIAAYVFADGPQPSVGLYWFDSHDPTIAPGMVAPLNQLLIRTDVPSVYYKSGSAATAWTKIGNGMGGGGTVGPGTTNTVAKFTAATTVGNSGITDDGTKVSTNEIFNPNGIVFTGSQTVTPGGNVNNYDPSGSGAGVTTYVLNVVTPTAGMTMTGLLHPANGYTFVVLENLGDGSQTPSSTLTLTHQDSSSSSANQFFLPISIDNVGGFQNQPAQKLTLCVGEIATLFWYPVHQHWFVFGRQNGACGNSMVVQSIRHVDQVSQLNTPSALGTSQENYAPTGWLATGGNTPASSQFRLVGNGLGTSTIGGLTTTGTAAQFDGTRVCFYNLGNDNITFKHRSGSSSVVNQFWLPNSSNFVLGSLNSLCFTYDGSLQGWLAFSSGITNSAGVNILTKSDGTNLIASSVSDNGTTVSTAEPITTTASSATAFNAPNGGATHLAENITFGCGPPALPATPTVTDSWDPWTAGGCSTTPRAQLIRVQTAQFGSILGSLLGGTQGDIVILENHGDGNESIGNGSLKILIRTTSDHSVPVKDHIFTPDLTNIVIPYTGALYLYYDSTTTGWIPIGMSVGGAYEQLVTSGVSLSYPLTPSALASGRTDNYDITTGGSFGCGLACSSWMRLNGNAGGSQLSGIVPHNVNAGPSTLFAQGYMIFVENIGGPITLLNENANSTAGNRFNLPNGDVVINAGQIVTLIYDQQGGGTLNQARWRMVNGYSSAVSGTSGDLAVFGSTGTTLGNYAGSTPSVCTAGQAVTQPALSAAGALTTTCAVFVNAAGTALSLSGSTLSLANTAVTPATYTNATITVDQQGRITSASSGSSGVTGAGTTNYLARWTSSSAVGTGLVTDDNVNTTTATGMFQAGPYNGVARDATSGWYVPATSGQWTTILNGTGIGGPSHLWLLQEASGTLADSIGSTTLTNQGALTYQASVTGWSRKAMQAPNANGGYYLFNNTDVTLPDSSTSYTVLLYVEITAAPSGDRSVITVGNCNGSLAGVTSSLFPKAEINGGTPVTGANSVGTTLVRPWLLRYNHTSSTFQVDTDLESISPVFATPNGTKEIFFGGAGCLGNAPGMDLLYGVMWQGSAAEMTNAQVAQLFARIKGTTSNAIYGDLSLSGFRWSTYVPTANHGTLSTDAINSVGRITSVGANNSVTLTFGGGGFGTTSHCFAQTLGASIQAAHIDVTQSSTAPIFLCSTTSGTTPTAANCPDFEYHCWGF